MVHGTGGRTDLSVIASRKARNALSPSFRRKPEPSNVKYFWIPGQARDYGSQTCRGAVFSETPSRSSSVDRLSRLGGMNTRTSA